MATVMVGTGEYSYEVDRNWAKLPKGWNFGTGKTALRALAVDSKDRVYVYNCGEHPVMVFDPDGNFLTSWGEGVITDAHGICISPDDHVFLVDRDVHQVLKFTADGKLVMALGNKHKPSLEAPFNHPADVAVAPTGEIYVADGYGNSRVHKFTADGKHLLSWGTPGIGPIQFNVPHSVCVDKSGRVYVADRDNNRVQVFNGEGQFISQWRYFLRPTDIYIDKNEAIYVTDMCPRVTILDTEGNILSRGRTEDAPHGIWGDSMGNFYVALVFEKRVEKHLKKS